MADRDDLGLPHATDEQCDIGPEDRTFIGARVAESRRGEAEPALGGDAHGPASGLDYAELGDTKNRHGEGQQLHLRQGSRQYRGASGGERDWRGEAEPALGGKPDGSSGGLDYAELCVTCDNRTDELRLLGNGVVPATAELAFRTLLKQLISET